ncbi:acyltransferase [Sphingomonas koreensis]|nr:acyltransferase [Sphingomonas koreensis]
MRPLTTPALAGIVPPIVAVTPARIRSAYRPDIDGLRAVAVLPVVLYHSGLGVVSGGFVGVDIFFVISGYLITQLLVADMEGGRFSLVRFYERRIRRIFPALFVLLGASAIASTAIMLPRDLADFGITLVAAAASAANVLLWWQSDYFAASAQLKPMLHTWSLGVEEQFYLFWPLLLLALKRLGRRTLIAATVVILVGSFAACVWMTDRQPSAAFYLLPFRAWELALGAVLALGLVPAFRSNGAAQIAGVSGLAMIGYAVIAFSDAMPFPGASAAIPCIGTALVIQAGRDQATLASALLSRPAAVFCGQISYSFYLWHWPLFVFARYRMIDEPPHQLMIEIAFVALLCAALSWRFIERPVRTGQVLRSRRALFVAAAAMVACTSAFGGVLVLTGGLPQRVPPKVAQLSAYSAEANPYPWHCDGTLAITRACVIGDPARLRIALLGDSHAAALRAAMGRIGEDGPATLYGAASRCPPLLGYGPDAACIAANARNVAFLEAHPAIDTVVLAGRWTYYYRGRAIAAGPAETNGDLPDLQDAQGWHYPQFTAAARRAVQDGITAMVDRLLAAGKTVVLVYPIPETGHDIPFTLARLDWSGRPAQTYAIPASLYRQRQADTVAMLDRLGRNPRLRRVYPATVLCDGEQCAAARNGVPLYMDSNHLNARGAELLAPAIAQAAKP